MLSFSMRITAKRLLTAGCLLAAVTAAALIGGSLLGGRAAAPGQERAAGATEAERQSFIRSFGWEVPAEPDALQEVLIPAEFDAVYQRYNEIQKGQGMDLSSLRGKRCRRYSYAVQNYPGYPDTVTLNLLVRDGEIVGGDLSAAGADGFSHGFAMPAT